jgi:hypothetical protein
MLIHQTTLTVSHSQPQQFLHPFHQQVFEVNVKACTSLIYMQYTEHFLELTAVLLPLPA